MAVHYGGPGRPRMSPQSPQLHSLSLATKHVCEPAVLYVLFQVIHGVSRPAHSCAVSVESPLSLPIANNFLRLIAPLASSGTAVVLMALSMVTLAIHTGAPWPVLDLVGKPFQPPLLSPATPVFAVPPCGSEQSLLHLLSSAGADGRGHQHWHVLWSSGTQWCMCMPIVSGPNAACGQQPRLDTPRLGPRMDNSG